MLITREEADRSVGSVVVLAAILVIEMEDVFVARIACCGQIWANWENILCLRSGISYLRLELRLCIVLSPHTGTASITKSTSDKSSSLVLCDNRSLAAVASSLEILPLATSFSSNLSANFKPLSIEACELSISLTGTEAFCAATSAIPRP